MPDGNELGNPDLVLGQDRAERIVPAIAFLPCPSPPRRARFLAALPDARLSSIVADRSCTTAGDCDHGGPDFVMDRSCPDELERMPAISGGRSAG